MSQRLAMNYRHSSLGQQFMQGPWQEGWWTAGGLDLEEAASPFPVPTAQPVVAARRTMTKDPKCSPIPGWELPCDLSEMLSLPWTYRGLHLAVPSMREDWSTQSQGMCLIFTAHICGVFNIKIQGESTVLYKKQKNSHLLNKDFMNLLGRMYVYLVLYSLSWSTLLACSVCSKIAWYTHES